MRQFKNSARNFSAGLLAVIAAYILGRACEASGAPLRLTALSPHGDNAETITLAQAVGLALRNNYRINISKEELPRTNAEIYAKRTEALPHLQTFVLPGQNIVSPMKDNFAFVGLAAQPLTQLYRVGIGLNIAHIERDSANESVRLAMQEAINQVKQTYYLVLERQQALVSIAEEIRYLKELTHVVEKLVVQGAALDVDMLEVHSRLATAEYEQQNLDDTISTGKEQLNHLMGRDPRIPFAVADLPEPIENEQDIRTAENDAIKQRPELQQQQLLVRRLLEQRKLILSRYIPDVSVGITSLETRNLDISFPRNFMNVGFVASYELYDWNRKGFLASAERVKARQAELKLSDLIDQVLVDVRDKFRQVGLARRRVGVASMRRDAARERLRVETKRLNAGASQLSQVLQAEASFAQANRDCIDSSLALWAAKSELDRATGRDF